MSKGEGDSSIERSDLLHAYLAEHDASCPSCGYNLRHLPGKMCPECGQGLKLQVGLVEPRLASYVTLLCAAALGFGGAALMLLLVVLRHPTAGYTTNLRALFWPRCRWSRR